MLEQLNFILGSFVGELLLLLLLFLWPTVLKLRASDIEDKKILTSATACFGE